MPQISFRTLLVVISLAVGLWVLLSWRTEAQVQLPVDFGTEVSPRDAARLLEDALRETFEIDARVTPLDDAAEAEAQMASVDQAFLVRVDGETRVATPRDLFNGGWIGEVWTEDDWTLNVRYFLAGWTRGGEAFETFLRVEIGDDVAIVALRGTVLVGMLPSLSRLMNPTPIDDQRSSRAINECSDWMVLTRNIFRQPAEMLQSCMLARCDESEISQCRVSAIPTAHGWTTQIDLNPGAPIEGISIGDTCTTVFGYEIKHFVGDIPVPIVEFTVGRSISGAVTSRFTCDGTVTLKHR